MPTELKIETNRANAPKFGLTASQLGIKPEEREEFDEMLAAYQTEINPKGAIQRTLFDELVTAAWNLRRVRILESALDLLDPRYDRLARHKTRIERTFHRTLKELKVLQTDRTLNRLLPAEIREKIPLLASPLVIAKRTQQLFDQACIPFEPPLRPAAAAS